MIRYSDENIPPNYEKVSKSSTKDLYSMLAAWLYKEKYHKPKLGLKDLCFPSEERVHQISTINDLAGL